MPYRVACPPAALPEVEEPYVAVLRAQRRRARVLMALAVLAAATVIAKVAPSGARARRQRVAITEATRQASARTAIARARTHAYAAQDLFEHAMRAAIGDAALPAPAERRACPIALPEEAGVARTAFPLLIVDHVTGAGTLPSQAIAALLADVARAEAHLAAGRFEEATLYARALEQPERLTYDVVLVARSRKDARALEGASFEPGIIEGRAYLFDFTSGRVVCSGDVSARSSRAIGYVYSDRLDTPASLGARSRMVEAIDRDLRHETERATARSMLAL